ncbi:MAG TPA: M20/M25/M40 family metallo-hydrolase [Gemmatimonadaceae bacterium]|nr:M20/M25/M40 family metallo-hydrolase [Gemmatimonadaceae bacterium]
MPVPLDPVTLAAALMRHESTSGQEGAVVAFAESLLRERGWEARRIPVSAGRDCLLATAAGAPLATLSTHLDTVPPYIPPRLADGVLHGRGACDAKGIAAAMWCAAERLRDDGVPVALLFVVGEETAHDGAHAADAYAREHGLASRVLVNGEPTESTLAVGTKGAVRVTLHCEGRAAHSAYPELGHSATMALVRLLAELDDLPLPSDELLGATTVNVGSLAGGVADNVVAPWAEARLMARLVTPAEEVVERLRVWVGDRATLDVGVSVPPVRLGTLPGFPTSVAAYATDIPALTSWGTPYLFGPGSIHVAHTPDEHVRADELVAAVDAYERIVRGALGERR